MLALAGPPRFATTSAPFRLCGVSSVCLHESCGGSLCNAAGGGATSSQGTDATRHSSAAVVTAARSDTRPVPAPGGGPQPHARDADKLRSGFGKRETSRWQSGQVPNAWADSTACCQPSTMSCHPLAKSTQSLHARSCPSLPPLGDGGRRPAAHAAGVRLHMVGAAAGAHEPISGHMDTPLLQLDTTSQ